MLFDSYYVPVKSKLQHPPLRNPPRAFEFLEIFFIKFPPPRAEKLFKCPHPRENYKSSLNTFKYGTKLVKAFGFQPVRQEYAIFSFEFIKICLRRLREISATRAQRSNSPPPMSGDQMPSLLGRKRRQMPGWHVEASI